MKVSELIAKLQAMPQELEVYSLCDRGQSVERYCSPCIVYAEDNEDHCYDDFTSCEEDAIARGWTVKFVML